MSDSSTPEVPVRLPGSGSEPTAPPPSVDDVTGLLRAVVDPELGADIVELGMVRRVDVRPSGDVRVEVALTIAGCPLRAQIRSDVVNRLESHNGVRSVQVDWGEMTSEQRSDVMARARRKAADNAPDTEVPAATRVLAVASGKGGVGKSSVTVNVAAALASRGLTVGVLDADIWGFSVPRMLGVEDRLVAHEGKIHPIEKKVGGGLLKIVSTGLIVEAEETALMWRGLMLTKAVEQFLRDVRWGGMDYLLVDLPPGTGDVQMGLSRLLPRAEMIIVTTPALAAQKVAIRAADMARRSYLRVVGVIENMTAFTCEHGTTYELFGSGGGGALAHDVGVALLGQVPMETAVAAGGDNGEPVAIAGTSPAAEAFCAIADLLIAQAAPPFDAASCTATA